MVLGTFLNKHSKNKKLKKITMPDISMCRNILCPLSKDCYRFMAEPNTYRQSYGRFEPKVNKETKKLECEDFILLINKK